MFYLSLYTKEVQYIQDSASVRNVNCNPKLGGKINASLASRLNNLLSIVATVKPRRSRNVPRRLATFFYYVPHARCAPSRSSQLRAASSTESIKYKAPRTMQLRGSSTTARGRVCPCRFFALLASFRVSLRNPAAIR